MKRKILFSALSWTCAFSCALGVAGLLSKQTVTADTGATTAAYEDISFVCKNSSTNLDDTTTGGGGYFRDDLSDYLNSAQQERLNSVGRYFDSNNFGIWEFPVMEEYTYESVSIVLNIGVYWKIGVVCTSEKLSTLDGVTFETGTAEDTEETNIWLWSNASMTDAETSTNKKAIAERTYDITSYITKGSSKYIYLKVSDPTTNAGNGPQITGGSVVYTVPVAHSYSQIVSDGTDENVLTAYDNKDGSNVITKNGASNTDYVYFDYPNIGVWSFSIPAGKAFQGAVMTKIYKDWTISIAFGAANAAYGDLTFETLNEQTTVQSSAAEYVWTFSMKGKTAENVYVRVQDPSDGDGNGPRVSYMGVRFDYSSLPEIVTDASGNVPVDSTLSLYDAIGLQYAIGDRVNVEDIKCEVSDTSVLTYENGSLTGLKNGNANVTVKVGAYEKTVPVTVDGFTEVYKFTTNALNNSHYRSEEGDFNLGGAYNGTSLYFDKANIGVWEIPVATDAFKSAALTANLKAVWQLEVAVGAPNVDKTGYEELQFHEISSNVVSAVTSWTDYTFDLDKYITQRGVEQSLYVRISDPTEGNGSGPQIYRLTVTYNYDKNRVIYSGGNVANDYVAYGEKVTLPVAVNQTGVFLGWSLNGALYFDGAEVTVTQPTTTFTAETIDFSMKNGASIRVCDTAASSGIRFESKFLTADYNEDWIIGYGTLILPTDSITSAKDFVLEKFVENETILKIESTVSETSGDYTVFRGGIIRILDGNYTRSFSARGYMCVKDALGTERYIYTDFDDVTWENSRSVYQVAYNFKTEDPDEYAKLTTEKQAVVDTYIAAGTASEEEE